jgi:hypothetical protein
LSCTEPLLPKETILEPFWASLSQIFPNTLEFNEFAGLPPGFVFTFACLAQLPEM